MAGAPRVLSEPHRPQLYYLLLHVTRGFGSDYCYFRFGGAVEGS